MTSLATLLWGAVQGVGGSNGDVQLQQGCLGDDAEVLQ